MFEKFFNMFKKKSDDARLSSGNFKLVSKNDDDFKKDFACKSDSKSNKQIYSEIKEQNKNATRGIISITSDLKDVNKKINSLEDKIKKTKNSVMIKEYFDELKYLKRKKIMLETSIDARKRI
ncbi:MAG: hypothetical protein WC755_04500 [Candidatus Woesearchaeota archaeon]|jgi:predicted  nucleic acid-binding Zn-ribbon protein